MPNEIKGFPKVNKACIKIFTLLDTIFFKEIYYKCVVCSPTVLSVTGLSFIYNAMFFTKLQKTII